jgi:nucleoside-diphosphate-sugar epimerase
MTKKRIFFTGGSGKAGKHVIPYLLEQGHRVLNVDLTPLNHPGVDNLAADITDSGQMFNAMSSYAGLDELEYQHLMLSYILLRYQESCSNLITKLFALIPLVHTT